MATNLPKVRVTTRSDESGKLTWTPPLDFQAELVRLELDDPEQFNRVLAAMEQTLQATVRAIIHGKRLADRAEAAASNLRDETRRFVRMLRVAPALLEQAGVLSDIFGAAKPKTPPRSSSHQDPWAEATEEESGLDALVAQVFDLCDRRP